ncbi:MAG: hypothetical protein U9O24_01600 [Campylobacterota bacterium]|nr:hypothetical protein [Campylobacterota bacterium]
MLYENIRKGLIYFWATTFIIIGLKILSDYIDPIASTVTSTISTVNTSITETTEEFNAYKLPIKEKFTMRVEGINSCQAELEKKFNLRLSDLSISHVGNECDEEVCELVVDFKNEVPEFVEIAIKESDHDYCKVKRFEVKKKYISLSYTVELILTDELREKLGSVSASDKITLKNAKDYDLSGSYEKKIGIFIYDEKVEKDMILVNGEERLEVRFY